LGGGGAVCCEAVLSLDGFERVGVRRASAKGGSERIPREGSNESVTRRGGHIPLKVQGTVQLSQGSLEKRRGGKTRDSGGECLNDFPPSGGGVVQTLFRSYTRCSAGGR